MNNLTKLRNWLKDNNIQIFVISCTDEFLSEYIAPYAERLKWISNFSGSAGTAIIMQKIAVIFVDGRYIVQAQEQVDENDFIIKHLKEFNGWLKKNLQKNVVIGIDPNLHSKNDIENIKQLSIEAGAKRKFLDSNPIDLIWHDQPSLPQSKSFIHDIQYSGRSVHEKISQIRSILKSNQCDYYILTALDSIAWLLNLRGKDILYTPINFAYVIVTPIHKVELFVEKKKVQDIQLELQSFANCHSLKHIFNFIKKISPQVKIGIDYKNTPFIFEKILSENYLSFKYIEDPCIYPKAEKNNVELQGARNANIRDGVSITKFCYWLKNEMVIEETDEISAAQKLFSLREKNELFFSLSFNTISAIGKHAALPHYNVTENSNLPFQNNTIYLFDSGAQYYDGTTDITRTVIIGKPTREQRDRFTRVLKGHIALAAYTFKNETRGSELDHLARKSLQEIGYDYDHGTGHGIGSFLSVHEGPQRISKTQNKSSNDGLLLDGMILSNEPGFYKLGKYGIRTENLIVIKKISNNNFCFEVISWAPIDVELVEISLLSSGEIKWVNWYHQQVFNKLQDKLNDTERKWLQNVTQPIIKKDAC